MNNDLLEQEKLRFNALSKEEAKRIASACDGALPSIRSCWYCNGAHQRLKDADYLRCYACGISYVRGIPVPILGMRMRGEEITDEVMARLNEALRAAN